METRKCRVCGITKNSTEFYAGQGNTCKKCSSARTKAWRKANPARFRATRSAWEKDNIDLQRKRRKNRIKRRYHLSHERFVEMLEEQQYKCKICRVPLYDPFIYHKDADRPPGTTKPVVDHDHRDGHVRGLLCSACNVAIGLFEDDIKIIKAAFYYLRDDRASALI